VYLAWWWLEETAINSQNQLFRRIEKRILNLVASYELVLTAAKKDSSAPAKVNYCIQMMRRLGAEHYESWFHKPDSSRYFRGTSPRAWFVDHGHRRLAESLVHKRVNEASRIKDVDLPLDPRVMFDAGIGDDPVRQALSVQRAFAQMSAPDDWLRNALKAHHPSEHGVPPRAHGELIQLYFALIEEAERLLKVLSEATEKDDFLGFGSFSAAALLCVETLLRLGPMVFGEWYLSAQPEFGGFTPNAWFIRGDSYLLAAVFQSFIPSLTVRGKQWNFVRDCGVLKSRNESNRRAFKSTEKRATADK
jgi:hypothetical protein